MLIITTEKIFNVHKNAIKREMKIMDLGGRSKLTENKKQELTIQFYPDDYDYRFFTEK